MSTYVKQGGVGTREDDARELRKRFAIVAINGTTTCQVPCFTTLNLNVAEGMKANVKTPIKILADLDTKGKLR